MLEHDWNSCKDIPSMLSFLRHKVVATDRKLRLFAVACCRHLIRQVLVDPSHSNAIDVAERYADAEATTAELIAPFPGCQNVSRPQKIASIACRNATETGDLIVMADCCAENAAWAVGENVAIFANIATNSPIFIAAIESEKVAQASILRDIVGTLPFRRVPLATDFHLVPTNRNVINLAMSIYEKQAFTPERMMALADALRDAHCENEEIISHCRKLDQTHVRGCWIIDLILGRT
jgi:hypothetical protein